MDTEDEDNQHRVMDNVTSIDTAARERNDANILGR